MRRKTQLAWWALTAALVACVVVLVVWLSNKPAIAPQQSSQTSSPVHTDPALRLGLIPERDILEQRTRYRTLADYLARMLERPVELVTVNTYSGVLSELDAGHIDAAFVGSMVAVIANDRLGARVLVKPQALDGTSSYCGVVFVRNDSTIQSIDDLAGKSIALVRTTTAGDLFPIYLLFHHHLLDSPDTPQLHWAGTHDEVVREVADKQVDAGAAKDLRVKAMQEVDPSLQLRSIAVSQPVPNNALIVHRDMADTMAQQLSGILLSMHESQRGRDALEKFGAQRFLPCSIDEYQAVYDMIDELGPAWSKLGVDGPAPGRPPPVSPTSSSD